MPGGRSRRPRDENGWVIPTKYTTSFYIYRYLRRGLTRKQIAKLLDISLNNAGVLIHRVKHPDRHRLYNAAYYKNGHRKRLGLST